MNLPPKFRSSLRSIQLLGVLSSDLLKQRGTEVFLKSFLSDLNLLRDGITFMFEKKRKWYGILMQFVGDMPASNFIGGFKEGVGAANLPCRSCTIKRNDLDRVRLEFNCTLRDKLSHEIQVAELENANESSAATAAQRDAISSGYGINSRCIFSSLGYFDATKCFMHDLMHISNEGILNRGIALLLKYLILHPIIRLDIDLINYKISTLKSHREFTTPPQIRKSEVMDLKKLSFSSAEIGSLEICLALVLGEFVSDEDSHYANFLLLLEILASLQCYRFSEKDLRILSKNIEIHNRNHVLLYPKPSESDSKSITPKLHSLIHFASQIRMFGPPALCLVLPVRIS